MENSFYETQTGTTGEEENHNQMFMHASECKSKFPFHHVLRCEHGVVGVYPLTNARLHEEPPGSPRACMGRF